MKSIASEIQATPCMVTYHRLADGQYECPECHVIKRLQSTMHYHMKTHQERPTLPCTHCTKTFFHKRTLEMHVATKHATANLLACPLCTYRTSGKGNLIIHCLRMHFKEEVQALIVKKLNCGTCSRTFGSLTAFYYHAKGCLPSTDRLEQVRGIL